MLVTICSCLTARGQLSMSSHTTNVGLVSPEYRLFTLQTRCLSSKDTKGHFFQVVHKLRLIMFPTNVCICRKCFEYKLSSPADGSWACATWMPKAPLEKTIRSFSRLKLQMLLERGTKLFYRLDHIKLFAYSSSNEIYWFSSSVDVF